MAASASTRASRESWALAALQALSRDGVDGVAVEAIAKQLGVTKGSFYWHFKNRAELLDAALDLWEQRSTTDIIVALERIPDPAERLRQILRRVSEAASAAPSHAALSATGEPSVARALQRVASARLGFLTRCYAELGQPHAAARRSAFLAYAAYLGMIQLGHDAPTELRTAAEREAYTEHVIATLVPKRARTKS